MNRGAYMCITWQLTQCTFNKDRVALLWLQSFVVCGSDERLRWSTIMSVAKYFTNSYGYLLTRAWIVFPFPSLQNCTIVWSMCMLTLWATSHSKDMHIKFQMFKVKVKWSICGLVSEECCGYNGHAPRFVLSLVLSIDTGYRLHTVCYGQTYGLKLHVLHCLFTWTNSIFEIMHNKVVILIINV